MNNNNLLNMTYDNEDFNYFEFFCKIIIIDPFFIQTGEYDDAKNIANTLEKTCDSVNITQKIER